MNINKKGEQVQNNIEDISSELLKYIMNPYK